MRARFNIKNIVLVTVLSMSAFLLFLKTLRSASEPFANYSFNNSPTKQDLQEISLQKIVIAIVVCGVADEAITLVKSVLISAKISKAKMLEFHIVTEDWLVTVKLKMMVSTTH